MPRRQQRFVSLLVLGPLCSLGGAAHVAAQSSNGTTTLTHETISAGGGRTGSGNPLQALTLIGDPSGGRIGSGSFTLIVGTPSMPRAPAPGRRTITVEGRVTEAVTAVTVNSTAAIVTGMNFRAEGITITEGPNTLNLTATDIVGNRATQTITVTLDTRPPARPTVVAPPAVTTASSYTFTGTKTPGTSIWVNGTELVALGDATSWTVSVSLVEGDNIFVIVAKDAAGNPSATHTIIIVVDNLPPVVTITAPAKTNLNPCPFTGTVDDSLTRVEVNGLLAARVGRTFQVPVPLIEGANTLTVTATSPRAFVTTRTVTVTLGTIPTITSVQPPDRVKLPVGSVVNIQATATDKEHDPLQCQIMLDGQILVDWSTQAMYPWTPTDAQRGPHALEIRVRDDFGGFATQTARVYVVRSPVSHP